MNPLLNKQSSVSYNKKIKEAIERDNLTLGCIIPAYNEADRIHRVLEVVKDYEVLQDIIVINDNSDDNTEQVVETFVQNTNKLKLINLESNRGKTGAVMKGIEFVNTDLIVMLDADLIGLTKDNLDKLIYPIVCGDYAMTILDRPTDRKAVTGITGLSRLLGGERALWRKDFLNAPLNTNDGYALETKLNMYFLETKQKIRTVYAPNLQTITHIKKDGILKGTKLYIDMFWKMYKATKLKNVYIQAADVEYDQLEELYSFYNKRKHKNLFRPIVFISVLISSILVFLILNLKQITQFFKRKQSKK